VGAPDESPAASIDAQRPAQHPQALIVTMSGRLDRADAARYGDRVDDALAAAGASEVVCDVGGLIEPDAAAVDAICRIRLAARRRGARLRLRHASAGLLDLIDLVGLCDVLSSPRRSGLET
jgi:anti-anti-sigma factor